jgi:pimeloyl-ACP methyl ester carboxylesterase
LSPFGRYINRIAGFSKFCTSFSSVFGANSKPSQQELELFWEVINYNQGKHLFHNLITYMRDRRIHRERWVAALQAATIPLGIINGSVDPVSGAHLVDRYKELECRLDYLRQLPHIGHYPHTEDPESVANAYLEFLATCTHDR